MGHSLGAALALLYSVERSKAAPCAAPCPRVGDAAFCRAVAKQLPRLTTTRNDAGVVPNSSPRTSLTPPSPISTIGARDCPSGTA